MTNQEKVTQVYPEAWFRVSGPHSAMIWSSSSDERKCLAESRSSRNRDQLWSAAWAVVRSELTERQRKALELARVALAPEQQKEEAQRG